MKQSKPVLLLTVLTIIFLISIFSTVTIAQVEGTDMVLAKSVKLTSKVLNRDLDIPIYVPQGYNNSSARYPVLYDLNSFFCFTYDCGTVELFARNATIPNMIVVGVPALQNGYVPTPFEERGDSLAGADLSIKFFKEELIPFVENNYRTNKFSILYGHSVGGLFTMYTLFNYPDLFTAYIAGSPWFQTNDQYWLKNIEKMAKERKLDQKFLFMTVGKGEAELTLNTYKELEQWMNNQSFGGLTWKSAWVEGNHGSMVGRNIYDGLLFIFSDWQLPEIAFRTADIDELKRSLKACTEKWGKYGFERSAIIPEQRLNAMGYNLLNRNEHDKAVSIFKYTVELYPESYNAHDSLAEAYLTLGDKENAIKFYKLAVKLNPGDSDFSKRVLQNSQHKLQELGVK
ncbi:tetratricopeptide repeat protein [candidate division KSB1 bacterium]|nr:tetratricopeptide repeat protein [candidate division KSB1 bacterium]